MSSELIYCQKLKKMSSKLETQPYPGPLGLRIQEQISADGWSLWLGHQTMLINEYRLSLLDPKARSFLKSEMEKFLFGEGSEKPKGFVPVSE